MLPLLLSLALMTATDSLPGATSLDGPYLVYEPGGLVAHWVDTEGRVAGKLPFAPERYAELPHFTTFRPELVDPERKFPLAEAIHHHDVDRIVALSDVHGQFDVGRALLLAHGVIDTDNNWSYGEGHLVVVGDIFDRGDQVTEMLWLIHNLQLQARTAGGRVHFLLGNHETMTLEGDDRYLNGKYRITSGLTGKFYHELYGPDTYLGRWLRSLPLAVEIDRTVFVHGGLSRAMLRQVSSLDRINKLYHDYLIDVDDMHEVLSESEKMSVLHGRMGPLWYRGYFSKDSFTERDLNYVLRKIDADRIVVGHTSFTAIQGFYDNQVVAVDSSIKFGSVGELLLLEAGQPYRGTLSGERIPLTSNAKK